MLNRRRLGKAPSRRRQCSLRLFDGSGQPRRRGVIAVAEARQLLVEVLDGLDVILFKRLARDQEGLDLDRPCRDPVRR